MAEDVIKSNICSIWATRVCVCVWNWITCVMWQSSLKKQIWIFYSPSLHGIHLNAISGKYKKKKKGGHFCSGEICFSLKMSVGEKRGCWRFNRLPFQNANCNGTWNSCVSDGREGRGKKNLLVRHVVKYHRDPLEMFKSPRRKKWIILIRVGEEGGGGRTEGRSIFPPSKDLKINARPPRPPPLLPFYLRRPHASLQFFPPLFFLNYSWRFVAGYLTQSSDWASSRMKKAENKKPTTESLLKVSTPNQVQIIFWFCYR